LKHQEVAYRIGTALTQSQVVFASAALVTVTFNADGTAIGFQTLGVGS
jgi:hypothetical protein